MKCATISYDITFEGEHSENYSIRVTKSKCVNTSNGLWRGSKNQRVLRCTFRRSKNQGTRVQKIGEIQ